MSDYKTVQDVIDGDLDNVEARIEAVESFLLGARLNGHKLTSGEEDALNSYVLRDDLRWSHPDKMTLIDYPFESRSQTERRAKKSLPLKLAEERGADGRDYRLPTKKKRSRYENWYVDKHAKARNKERREAYQAFTKTQPVVEYRVDPAEIEAELRAKYGRKLT
ncbi:hypothetical protein MM326_13735 [Alkalihalobacillus sp. LMS6]|jgi:hypothetical protein|uniref:hypothetical protein n=1 Tax=Alkalihalobacillus sp. LMS6 TaxID=2924034 RepID=UPI0020CFEBB0|nr:hypothetical protein [Alkalihalobacillus sp. LMS6]UTR05169.1 hypothetical protein MM326_13735 [Alkalihalobacillus sp. LMS6]